MGDSAKKENRGRRRTEAAEIMKIINKNKSRAASARMGGGTMGRMRGKIDGNNGK